MPQFLDYQFHDRRQISAVMVPSNQKSLAVLGALTARASQAVALPQARAERSSALTRRAATASTPLLPVDRRTFPADFRLANVKRYGAKGDGVTDDTAAIQRALSDGRSEDGDYYGRPKALYFPEGTYLVSNTLSWIGCCVNLQGSGRGVSVIKLKDNARGFNNSNAPKAVIKTPSGNMSFRQYIQDLTVDTGRNNVGAIGIDYISNNVGAITRVNIQSGDGKGHSGLNMTRSWPGPLLVKNLHVDGFDRGIHTGQPEYGLTLEDITLTRQKIAGILNEGNTLAIRKIISSNSVPAIKNTSSSGSIMVLNGNFNGGSANTSAIVNNGYLYARNIFAQGYTSAIQNRNAVVSGSTKAEYVSDRIFSLFSSPQKSLNLPVPSTPTYEDRDLSQWAKFTPNYYGDTSTLQSVLNSGKSTVYFPFGNYFTYNKRVVTVPASVRRIVGFSSGVNSGPDEGGIVFRVAENSTRPLIIEQFGYGVSVEHASSRVVVLKHGGYRYTDSPQAGALFLEDVGMGSLRINYPHNVWARQLNAEAAETKVVNNGGNVWILGLKTENTGTVIKTSSGGKTELLGTLIYPARSFSEAQLQDPAFINEESSHSLIYSLSSYVANGNYRIQVRDVRNGVVRDLFSDQLGGMRMPLFVGYP
jgi:hypothetical protein